MKNMKKQLIVIFVVITFLMLCFSGCQQLEVKPDYITVKCRAEIISYIIDKNNNTIEETPVGLTIKVDFIKDGGERFTHQCVVEEFGEGTEYSETVSFKLYKEQPIEAVISVQGGYKDYDPLLAVQYKTLAWAQVKASADFGGEYSWTPSFEVILQNSTAS
jgi:hypothetical protein